MTMRKAGILLAAIVPVALIFAVACSDDADSDSSASQASIEELSARVQRNEQVMALNEIGKTGLHDIEVTLAAGTVEPWMVPNTRTAVRMLGLTDWGNASEDAETVESHGRDLLQALADGDLAAAQESATLLHDSSHDFTDSMWLTLTEDLRIGEPDDHGDDEDEDDDHSDDEEDDDHSDDETPSAEATP